MQNETVSNNVLTIEQQKKISITCVESVDSFSDTEIKLTVNGKRVQITGSGLKVLAFSKGTGNLNASGEVTSVKFGGTKGKIFQRLFK